VAWVFALPSENDAIYDNMSYLKSKLLFQRWPFHTKALSFRDLDFALAKPKMTVFMTVFCIQKESLFFKEGPPILKPSHLAGLAR
jgi:hypothetical protein